MKLLYHIIL